MITKELTYKKAFELKKLSLTEKTQKKEMMLASAYASNPRLNEIDNNLASVGAQLALAALSGDKKIINDLKEKSQLLSTEKNIILKKAGLQDITFDCPICQDTGFVGGKICECIKKLANSILLQEFKKEMPLDDCRFDNFDLKYYSENSENARGRMSAILELCKEYVINFNPENSPNLLFMGDSGLGKTHLTLAIVSGVIEKGFSPIYGPAENLFSLIEKERFLAENKGAYKAMVDCDLLVIDDLGTEASTVFSKSALYNLINSRMLSKKPTIINTNLTMTEIKERYAPRVASRLIGSFNAKKFLGEDIRQQKILGK